LTVTVVATIGAAAARKERRIFGTGDGVDGLFCFDRHAPSRGPSLLMGFGFRWSEGSDGGRRVRKLLKTQGLNERRQRLGFAAVLSERLCNPCRIRHFVSSSFPAMCRKACQTDPEDRHAGWLRYGRGRTTATVDEALASAVSKCLNMDTNA
jgi:hypothetical protein